MALPSVFSSAKGKNNSNTKKRWKALYWKPEALKTQWAQCFFLTKHINLGGHLMEGFDPDWPCEPSYDCMFFFVAWVAPTRNHIHNFHGHKLRRLLCSETATSQFKEYREALTECDPGWANLVTVTAVTPISHTEVTGMYSRAHVEMVSVALILSAFSQCSLDWVQWQWQKTVTHNAQNRDGRTAHAFWEMWRWNRFDGSWVIHFGILNVSLVQLEGYDENYLDWSLKSNIWQWNMQKCVWPLGSSRGGK